MYPLRVQLALLIHRPQDGSGVEHGEAESRAKIGFILLLGMFVRKPMRPLGIKLPEFASQYLPRTGSGQVSHKLDGSRHFVRRQVLPA